MPSFGEHNKPRFDHPKVGPWVDQKPEHEDIRNRHDPEPRTRSHRDDLTSANFNRVAEVAASRSLDPPRALLSTRLCSPGASTLQPCRRVRGAAGDHEPPWRFFHAPHPS